MRDILPRMRGALLGLAVGDAMGYTVDSLRAMGPTAFWATISSTAMPT